MKFDKFEPKTKRDAQIHISYLLTEKRDRLIEIQEIDKRIKEVQEKFGL